jgi:hypothetical protein
VRGVGSSNLPVPTKPSKPIVIPFALVRGFVTSALATHPAGLQKYEGQGQSRVNPALAFAATHRVLQQQKSLNIFHAETG